MKVNTVLFLRHAHFVHLTLTPTKVMGNKDKARDGDAAANRDHRDSHANRDHSRDRGASRDATLAKTITEAVALQTQSIAEMFAKQKAEETQSITEAFTRQMERAHAQYEKLFKESRTATLPTTLKVTSSTDGFRVMDPFDWTMDKNVYQRWQLWLHKARLALDAMEGDTEKTKSPTCITGSMGKALPRLKDGKTARFFSVRLTMMP